MITGIDHVIILVADLETATAQYESVGFEVRRGGVHPGAGTENALIPLADGSYLELLAVSDPAQAVRHPLWVQADGQRRRPGEYGGFALSTDDVDREAQRILDAGVGMTPPADGSRRRPDQIEIRWRVSFPQDAGLPFLIEDVTAREDRIAPPRRGLGLRAGLSEVRVAVADLTGVAAAYRRVLGTPALGAAPAADEIHFLTPRGEITLLGAEYGARVHELVLAVADWRIATRDVLPALVRRGETWQVPRERAAGARIVLRPKGGA